ncbi:hypothetical protein DYD21_16665 [Rhodohalobacter sp. SW132]|nr:hypothetical protein DYD21_16665 [Rhodohalobacter sp. SW132]
MNTPLDCFAALCALSFTFPLSRGDLKPSLLTFILTRAILSPLERGQNDLVQRSFRGVFAVDENFGTNR